MLGKTVLVLGTETPALRAIRSSVVATGSQVAVSDDREAVLRALNYDLCDCLVIVDPSVEDLRCAYRTRSQASVVLTYTGFSAGALGDLPSEEGLTRVICAGERPIEVARKVAIVVESLLTRRTEGVEKWLPGYGIDFWNYTISGSRWRTDFLSCVADYLEWLGVRNRIAENIMTTADELYTNAVYNAPRDQAGRHIYSGLPRSREVILDERSHSLARFGSDGERFAISVRDPFGGFSWSRLSTRLALCLSDASVEDKDGGAGLGFFTTLKYASSIIVNVDPGRFTEVIVVFSLRKRQKDACDLIWTVAPTPTQSVGLSPNYRRELQSQLLPSGPEPVVVLEPRSVPRGTQVSARIAPESGNRGTPRSERRETTRRERPGRGAPKPLSADPSKQHRVRSRTLGKVPY